ncbi:MAG: hypothetical protein R6X27_10965 [Candidatus Desulfacyla sp.]
MDQNDLTSRKPGGSPSGARTLSLPEMRGNEMEVECGKEGLNQYRVSSIQ